MLVGEVKVQFNDNRCELNRLREYNFHLWGYGSFNTHGGVAVDTNLGPFDPPYWPPGEQIHRINYPFGKIRCGLSGIPGQLQYQSFGSWHPGGATFVFADGAVRFLNENMNFTTYQSLHTVAGGEVVGDY